MPVLCNAERQTRKKTRLMFDVQYTDTYSTVNTFSDFLKVLTVYVDHSLWLVMPH
jgi:hypothetical protein